MVLLAIILPFFVTAVPKILGADRSHTITSGSMEPAISTGNVVIVRDVLPGTIQRGDVSTSEFDGPWNLVDRRTNRVFVVADYGIQHRFRTKRDANEDPTRSSTHPTRWSAQPC